jgi:hypothetical protein
VVALRMAHNLVALNTYSRLPGNIAIHLSMHEVRLLRFNIRNGILAKEHGRSRHRHDSRSSLSIKFKNV